MLRITVQEEANSIAIVLEGRLAGDWVSELRSVWAGLQTRQKPLIVTLTEMSGLDPAGPRTPRRDSRKRRPVERLGPDGARSNREDHWKRRQTMKNKNIYIAVAAAVLIPLALFLFTFSASPLPKPEPYTGSLPSASSPKEMAVFALMTGVNHRVAAYGYRGGSLFERRDFSMAGTLVKHPKG